MATVEKPEVQMVNLEIDGQSVSVPAGSMIIEASDQIGIDIPRFCYHRKLSIAANCRMCLVDVEKAPKPLPACATPVAEGMKVYTESRRAVDAQRGVMEFLLINHPLDCPICDQGGECELQDLAMGYGRSVSRFTERKRVVKDKNLGSLVATDMTRCIHCTRCVRFLEEIAGTTELGGIGRGENTEISTFVERNINSELSGNIIDLCPVGALTNKPFRFSARAWEMRAKPSVASHDNVGSNLFYHARGKQIMRSVPKDNERINECWLSDRDRYSHFGLASKQLLGVPKIKVNGEWQEASWDEALAKATDLIQQAASQDPNQLGFLVSPRATSQEHFLLSKVARGLGTENVDHRLRISDFSHPMTGRAKMDMATADWTRADAIFLVGSNIRHDQPILGHRVRTAWRQHQAKVMDLNPVAYEFHFDLTHRLIQAPQYMVQALACLAKRTSEVMSASLPEWIGEIANGGMRSVEQAQIDGIVDTLTEAKRGLIVLGDGAMNHPQAGALRALVEWLSQAVNGSLCVLGGPANAEGAWRSGAVPGQGGLNAHQMLSQPRRAYVLFNFEPSLDTANSHLTMQAMQSTEAVIALSAFESEDLLAVADVLLPVAEVSQTDGCYVNLDGIEQHFDAAVAPCDQARPGWKVLRRLGDALGLAGFDFIDRASIDEAMTRVASARPDAGAFVPSLSAPESAGLTRIGDVPIYHTDSLTRRSRPLQDSDHAKPPVVRVHPKTAKSLGIESGARVQLSQQGVAVTLPLEVDARIAEEAIWLPSAQTEVIGLGGMYGPIQVEGAGQ